MADQVRQFPHEEDPALFQEALRYAEATSGFTASLIEKDYYCSLILRQLFRGETALVFRGGTCLSKVHVGFYRLSEDLDLVIPASVDATRSERRDLASPVRSAFDCLCDEIPGLEISEPMKGHNESRQYIGDVRYRSAVLQRHESLKIEVSLREDLLRPVRHADASTLALDPFTETPLLAPFTVGAMTIKEAFAEKYRAAVSRREPAIRDFFDLLHAVRSKLLNPDDAEFLEMVREKLQVKGNAPLMLSPDRVRLLEQQTEGRLRPVLRPRDFAEFSLEDACDLVRRIESSCRLHPSP